MKYGKQAGRAAVLTVLLAAGGSALAQRDSGLQLTVGLKLWANAWETAFLSDDPTTGTNTITSTNDGLVVAPIPSLSARWGNFVASIGYFAKTDYDFPTFSDFIDGLGVVSQTTKAEREEWDLNIGYFVLPRLALTVGYKKVDQTYSSTFRVGTGPSVAGTPSKTKNTAPTIGILGSAPLGDGGFTLYGNAAVGPMTTKSDGSSFKGSYQSSELGVAHPLGSTGAVITVGYKVQIIDVDTEGTLPQRARDTTNGLIVGVSYTF